MSAGIKKKKNQKIYSNCLSNNNKSRHFLIKSVLDDIKGKQMADNKKMPSKEKSTVHKPKNLELTLKISTWSVTDPIRV